MAAERGTAGPAAETTPRIRVLLVDDSAIVRRLVATALSGEAVVEVCGEASSGTDGIAAARRLKPDVMVLDVEMEGMSGLEVLETLRRDPDPPRVVMFSTLTERGATESLRALALGASDYVVKPSGLSDREQVTAYVRTELVPRVIALGRRSQRDRVPAAAAPAGYRVPVRRELRIAPVRIVAIGSSTGGPAALSEVIGALPADLGVPVVIVQHMPPLFTKLLAERLTRECRVPVREAAGGEPLVPGECLLAPGDHHLSVKRGLPEMRACVTQGPRENSCRPSVDVLFRSVAELYGDGVLAVVLTGMGSDGLRGAEHVVESGGQVLVQNEATSVVWGMPGYVARAGLADDVLALKDIGPEIARRAQRSAGYRASSVSLPLP